VDFFQQCSAVGDIQAGADTVHVSADGAFFQAEVEGDLFVGLALQYHLDDFFLAAREVQGADAGGPLAWGSGNGKGRDDFEDFEIRPYAESVGGQGDFGFRSDHGEPLILIDEMSTRLCQRRIREF
jgi:hypothetical protein